MRALHTYALLFVLLAGMLASSALADQLYAVAPSGKKYLIATCDEKETCEARDIDKGFCDEEGQWKVRFEAPRYDTAGNKLGEHTKETNAHVVNWDTEEYCRAECVKQSTVEWSSVVGQCCGDDRNASAQTSSGDCGMTGGNFMCGQTELGNWEYIDKQKDAGKIYSFFCPGISGPNDEEVEYVPVLAANTQFAVCGKMRTGEPAAQAQPTATAVCSYAECCGPTEGCNNNAAAADGICYYHIGECPNDPDCANVVCSGTGTTGALAASMTGAATASSSAVQAPFDFILASNKGLTHQYACFTNNDVPSIVECADNQTVLSTGSGALPIFEGTLTLPAALNAITGQNLTNVFGKGKKPFYCSSSARWIDSLDQDEAACIGAGFVWTGKHCCGDQSAEYYNDPWDGVSLNGGCFNSKHVKRGAFANATTRDGRTKAVLNVDGVFQGCVLQAGDPLLALKDKFGTQPRLPGSAQSDQLLIKNQQYCTSFRNASQGKTMYCDSTGNWVADATGNRSRLSRIRWEPENESAKTFECCTPNDCWNGAKCVTNQRGDATPTTTHGYRCINGNWVMQDLKFNWDRSKFGYCERNEQCLVDPQGNYDSNDKPDRFFNLTGKPPQCIASGQFILDNYCEKGNWSSRTKQLAIQLLDFASENSANDYSLFCDAAPETLNTLVFNTQFGAVSNFITNCTLPGGKTGPCVNNFCVLTYPAGVAFGTSMNVPVNDRQSYLRALDKPETHCNAAIDNDQNYNACDPRIWYDHATRSVIMFQPGTGTLTTPGADIEARYIRSPHDRIVSFVLSTLHMKPNNYSFYTNPKLFNNLYSTKVADYNAFAFFEEGQFEGTVKRDYMGIQGPVQFNVCELVKHFDPLSECNSTATTYVVTERSDVSTKLISVWKDLTAKLRPAGQPVTIRANATNQTQ